MIKTGEALLDKPAVAPGVAIATMDYALLFLALFGHAALWVALVNRAHGTGLARGFVHWLTFLSFGLLVAIPLLIAGWLLWHGTNPLGPGGWARLPLIVQFYVWACWGLAVVSVVVWVWRRILDRRPPAVLRSDRRRLIHLSKDDTRPAVSKDHVNHFLARLPGNQVLHLDFAERSLDVPRLHPSLDGLSIVHLSDLHFNGNVDKAFFREVVHLANQQRPDLVAVTGDLVDTDACIDWVPDTLGQLVARLGVYVILGNHDLKVDTRRLCRALDDAGMIHLGGRWMQIDADGSPIVIAGNELPWIAPAAEMDKAPPRRPDGQPLRILLSHSPDQLDWAVAQDFDLMLAGHLHGGQIRLPLIGPIVAPSSQGVRHAASGTFYRPPTILHVSRGLSGQLPLRLNCPPEVTRLVLNSPPKKSQSG
ncbi:MAG: metallophosphoesterase [Pirellulales bacterium]|nr:metallophosphoesterase [Pirellulales bacterium]